MMVRKETSLAATGTMREDNTLGARSLWVAALFSVVAAVAILLAAAPAASAYTSLVSAPSISSPPEGSYDADGAFVLSGSAPPLTKVNVYEENDGQLRHLGSVLSDGRWMLPMRGISEGRHAYKSRATNTMGTSSAWSNTRTVTVDTKGPAQPSITSPTEGSRLLKQTCDRYQFSGTAEPGSKVELFEGPTPQGTVEAPLSGNWTTSVYLPDLRTYYFKARATDIAGNVSVWSETRTISVVPNRDTSEAASAPECS